MSKRKLDESDWLQDNDVDLNDNDDISPDEIDNEIKCIDLQMDEIARKSSQLPKLSSYNGFTPIWKKRKSGLSRTVNSNANQSCRKRIGARSSTHGVRN